MALGMLLVIVAGHIDLSVGSTAGFIGALAAVLMVQRQGEALEHKHAGQRHDEGRDAQVGHPPPLRRADQLQNSYIVVMALGMLLVIVAGHIDLSVGSTAGFISCSAAPGW
jgi:ABC-type xylose transport system permease subunit